MRCVVQSLRVLCTAIFCASPVTAQAVTATAHVVITGGTKAGSYDAETTRAAGCSVGVAGKDAFGVQISDPRGAADRFNGVQLAAPNPSATGSSQFMMQVTFGSVLNRTLEYLVETRPTETKLTGSGRVAIEDAGSTASVTFYATTAAGIKVTGSVICKSVMRR